MQYLVFIAAVSGAALAENLLVAAPQRLHARQDLSFTPPTTLTTSCRSGEIICPVRYRGRGYCAAPALGDVCCAQGYVCPTGSFCLVDGECCPDGVDPATCAAEQGVTLPPDFQAGNTIAFTASSVPESSSSQAPSPATESTTAEASTTASSVAVIPTTSSSTAAIVTPPYVVPSNSSSVGPVATGAGVGQPSVTPFTGGAAPLSFGDFNFLAIFAGVVGMFL